MTNYFTNCTTAEELKAAYKKIVIKLHPDNNPGIDTTLEFQKMQQEFNSVFDRLKNIHVNAQGETYEKETTETAEEFTTFFDNLMKIPGIEIELCGAWWWITGNTKAVKDQLKAAGFKFSAKKAAWYFHRDPYRKSTNKSMSLDEIRNFYGSKTYKNNGSADLEALPA